MNQARPEVLSRPRHNREPIALSRKSSEVRARGQEAHGVSVLEVAISDAVSPVESRDRLRVKARQVRADALAGEWVPSIEELSELRSL